MESIFNNIITAIITPMRNGDIDIQSFEKLVQNQIESGIAAIVVNGSTGEGSSLSTQQKVSLLEVATNLARGTNCKIISAIASASTAQALDFIAATKKLTIDGLMATVPYYVKPNQKGIFEHFKMIDQQANMPIMIYIHPGRTGVDLEMQTIDNILELNNIQAIKDAGSDIERCSVLRSSYDDKKVKLLTGNDMNLLPYVAAGGNGSVSVLSNALPNSMNKICSLAKAGEIIKAQQATNKLHKIASCVYADTNPVGIKLLVSALGLCGPELMLPLIPNDNINEKILSIVGMAKELEQWGGSE